ncbi:MAG: class I SAM-dependent methyltransferase [bacterium]
MTEIKVQQGYDTWSDFYDPQVNPTRDLDKQITRQKLAHIKVDKILELGCGTGKNTAFLAERAQHVDALDFSNGMLKQAQSKNKYEHVHFTQADLCQRWPCDNNNYDLASCNLVVEHIQDLNFIFSEAFRVLKTGAFFYLSEYHPFRQYLGKQARFQNEGNTQLIPAFQHHSSEFLKCARANKLSLVELDEHWHEKDTDKPPRLITLLFKKEPAVR